MKPVVLLVDDEDTIRHFLKRTLRDEGYEALTAASGGEALEILKNEIPDLILLDLKLPDINGIEVLQHAKEIIPAVCVIMLTAFGDIETAVSAIKKGAFDFVSKPVNLEQLLLTIEKGLQSQSLNRELLQLRRRVNFDLGGNYIPGESEKMKEIYDVVKTVAKSDTTTVFIQGESGTGKEMIANMIHKYSPRHSKPFLEINCASLPEELLESELFGHEKGAFTGALERRRGRFELADGGTLFLDEVGDMSAETQAKLLRVLEEGEIERLGGGHPIPVNVRVISATNKDLRKEIDGGTFREDLFYRLSVIPISVPPLRDRPDDIPSLARHFLEIFSDEDEHGARTLTPESLTELRRASWPGNVRQLRNLIERLVIMTEGTEIGVSELAQASEERPVPAAGPESLRAAVETYEKDLIVRSLESKAWNVTEAAKVLNTDRANLHRKMRRYGIEKPE